ncbi:hypothetical protein DICPUDRAFT_88234 [Dictyostelium purpureum]|uniref:GRAM domain-containing protein n=1 Tax=Dictyostelium purpureum TaxID=5786 RepID=F0ZN67_DICPU|nr:uncharacterized protein DICPUDRAFT_88234 [Dictyostelium purpureum]EGC34628.1 hypothetical protein DICPUDRAFT_88234 [Dictyostelium purpureum]|eukprot:XP_003288853.1 hypothetical protein DICPUDRAFT_88234 [Dictyostelium purpureum]
MGRSRRGSITNSQSDISSSESDNEVLKRHMKLDEAILYCEGCSLKTGAMKNFKLRYNTFGLTNSAICFYGSFSLKKKRKIIPFKSISDVEWLEDDSVKLVVPRENRDKPKNYHIHFKKSHGGSPYRLIESRWQASKLDPLSRLSSGEELYRNPTNQNLLKHFQNIPRDERIEHQYRCRIKGSITQNYGILFTTQTRILFMSIDTTFKCEEIKYENVIEISESLPTKGKLKKSILIKIGKDRTYAFSSFENKEEVLVQLAQSWGNYKNNKKSVTVSTSSVQNTSNTYKMEQPNLPTNSKNSTWTQVSAPKNNNSLAPQPSPSPSPSSSAPSSPRPSSNASKTTTPQSTTTNNNNNNTASIPKPPSTPLLNEKSNVKYGDRVDKVFPKETSTELRQQEEIKAKGKQVKNRGCCSLFF